MFFSPQVARERSIRRDFEQYFTAYDPTTPCARGGISASNAVITFRVSSAGFRAFRRSTTDKRSIAIIMKDKSGQKSAIIVGMIIKYVDVLTKDLKADQAFYQAQELAE